MEQLILLRISLDFFWRGGGYFVLTFQYKTALWSSLNANAPSVTSGAFTGTAKKLDSLGNLSYLSIFPKNPSASEGKSNYKSTPICLYLQLDLPSTSVSR